MSLVIWRVVAPVWMQLRRPVLAAAALAVLAPFGAFPTVTSDNDSSTYTFLALDDTIGFFAFFVVGIAVRRAFSAREVRAFFALDATRAAAYAVFAAMLVGVLGNLALSCGGIGWYEVVEFTGSYSVPRRGYFGDKWVRGIGPYENMFGDSAGSYFYVWYVFVALFPLRLATVAATLTLFSCAEPLCVRLLAARTCCGRELGPLELNITELGSRSITNYIMHEYVLLLVVPYCTAFYGPTPRAFALVVLFTIVQSTFWMCAPVNALLRPVFLAPPIDGLLLDKPEAPCAGSDQAMMTGPKSAADRALV